MPAIESTIMPSRRSLLGGLFASIGLFFTSLLSGRAQATSPAGNAPSGNTPDDELQFKTFELSELQEQRGDKSWLQFMQTSTLYTGLYVLKAGATDGQSPHQHDEVYYVLEGKAEVEMGEEKVTKAIQKGSVIFIGAKEHHRFKSIAEDLHLLVFFSTADPSA